MAIATTRVHLFLRGEKMKDMDTFSKSDPYCVLYRCKPGRRATAENPMQYRAGEVGRTERIMNDLSPQFTKHIEVDYLFEQKQEFVIVCYDDDGHRRDEDNDVMGAAIFQLAHVVGSRNGTMALDMKPGKLYVTAQQVETSGRDTVDVQFAGKGLKKMDFFGKSDPYFKLFRVLPNGKRALLYKSRTIKTTLDPQWEPTPRQKLINMTGGSSDLSAQTLLFECWDQDFFSDDYMGEFKLSMQELMDAAKPADGGRLQSFTLRDKSKAKNTFGEIYVKKCVLNHAPTFMELLGGGLEINLAVAVDFTGSNGDPRQPHSLHYMNPQQPNQYVRAIMSVGEILMEYDTDKQVPAFGFGAQMPNRQISHFFNLNLEASPYVNGVQGILDAYGRALPAVRLAGPTNFSPTVTAVNQTSRTQVGTYTILLILTDGEITDMDKTIDSIVNSDDAPLSIIIVGVGNGCDFQMMNVLDGDDEPLRNRQNRTTRRDLVQFVPFRDFLNAPPGALAAEVLREVPDQVVDWALLNGVTVQQLQNLRGTAAAVAPPLSMQQSMGAPQQQPQQSGVFPPPAAPMQQPPMQSGVYPPPPAAQAAPQMQPSGVYQAPPSAAPGKHYDPTARV